MSGPNKVTAERNQRMLLELVNLPGNDVCADCKNKNPRWASYNLGIFICVNCASIHRKIGTHITKVKSLTLDSWTKEQVEKMKEMGNIRSNVRYNPDEMRHPPPTNMIDSERDSELEKYIRSKYEFKRFMNLPPSSAPNRSSSPVSSRKLERAATVAALLGPSRSASSRLSTISQTPPSKTDTASGPATTAFTAPTTTSQPTQSLGLGTPSSLSVPKAPLRSATQPVQPTTQAPPQTQSIILDATLPLQYAAPTPSPSQPMAIPMSSSPSFLSASSASPYSGLSASPHSPFPSAFAQIQSQAAGIPSGHITRSMSLNTGLGTQPYTGGGLSTSPNFANGLTPSSFQPSQITATASMPLMSSNPSSNPFQPQSLSSMGAGIGISSQLPNGFGTTQFMGQQMAFQPQQQQSQVFQPQPTVLQVPTTGNPFMQPQMTNIGTTPQYNSTPSPLPFGTPQPQPQPPSPFAATQLQPQGFQQMQPGMQPFQQQLMQQQPQAGFGAANPFTSWVQTPSQPGGGFSQGQQWM